MFGLRGPLGHLTSSGTIANLEALWVARELPRTRAILIGENAHYTHERMCAVIGAARRAGHAGRPRPPRPGRARAAPARRRRRHRRRDARHDQPRRRRPGPAVAELCARHGARLHVDAAYGGFHPLLADGGEPGVDAAPFAALARADSIVVDPHKHGLQPYGCGCVLFADPGVGRLYAHDSPYTYFTSSELHLGEISLECSRAGAAAAALWTTLEALPLSRAGLGSLLAPARAAAQRLAGALERLAARARRPPRARHRLPVPAARRASEISAACERPSTRSRSDGWHAAKLRVATSWLRRRHPAIEEDAPEVTTLRMVLMKPSHLGIVDELAGAPRDPPRAPRP